MGQRRGPKGREGEGSWEGEVPPLHQLGGLRERCKLHQWDPDRSPGELAILHIFK